MSGAAICSAVASLSRFSARVRRSMASRTACSVLGPKPGSSRSLPDFAALARSRNERILSSVKSFFTRLGPSAGSSVRSASSAGIRFPISSRSWKRPLSAMSAILWARSLPMPGSSERSAPSASIFSTLSGRFSMVRAAFRYARTRKAFAPSISSNTANRSKRCAISALCMLLSACLPPQRLEKARQNVRNAQCPP